MSSTEDNDPPVPLKLSMRVLFDFIVYALVKDGEILYVGKSCRGVRRIIYRTDHQVARAEATDVWIYKTESDSESSALERLLIQHFRPQYNVQLKAKISPKIVPVAPIRIDDPQPQIAPIIINPPAITLVYGRDKLCCNYCGHQWRPKLETSLTCPKCRNKWYKTPKNKTKNRNGERRTDEARGAESPALELNA